MFCFKCGEQIHDGANFCFKCGAAQGADTPSAPTVPVPTNGDYAREAIEIYLADVLALECIIQKLKEMCSATESEIQFFEAHHYCEQIQLYGQNYVWLRFDGNEYYVYMKRNANYTYSIDFSQSGGDYAGEWFTIKSKKSYLRDKYNWPRPNCPPNAIAELIYAIFVDSTYMRRVKRSFFSALEEFKKTAPQKRVEKEQAFQPTRDKREEILAEIKQAEELLQKAYALNIIPKQFRNIYAVWFIYDYITTSKESLSSAFLHCDLDEIKQKLDTIIEQQKEIIINQHILAAQNTHIIQQNQQTLERLAGIENNTERAAQYAEIASNNARACAWIGLANYIKD